MLENIIPRHSETMTEYRIEFTDEYGRKKAQIAREKFWEFADKEKYEIVRVVKDC